jgi:hypothetical protein
MKKRSMAMVFGLATGLTLLIGCATPPPRLSPGPHSLPLNVAVGKIGVVSTSTVPWFEYSRPKAKGTTNFRSEWGEKGITLGDRKIIEGLVGVAATVPMGCVLLGPPVAAGVAGTVAGAARDAWNDVTGLSQEDLLAADAVLCRFIQETSFQELLRAQIGGDSRDGRPLQLTVVKKPFPEGQEQEFSKLVSVTAGTLAWVPEGQNPRSYLEAQSIDTILEIRVHQHGLYGKKGTNPELRFLADVEARLIKLGDDSELWCHRFVYQSAPRKYVIWTAENAQALRGELTACCQSIARQIVDDLAPINQQATPNTELVSSGLPAK